MTAAPPPFPPGPRPPRRWLVIAVTLAAAAMVAVAVGGAWPPREATSRPSAVVPAAPGEPGSSAAPGPGGPQAPETTEPGPAPPTSADAPPCPPAAPPGPTAVPPALADEIGRRLADGRLAGQDLSLSVWVDGWGEVVRVDADRGLLPASNQKLLTAMGALEVLPPEGRFETRVASTVAPRGGEVSGDLVLVAGGDPTLTGDDLAALASQVQQAGIHAVRGDVVVDESRYDDQRAAEGWLDWHRPAYAGALSALVVDGNRYRRDQRFLDDPALAGAERFAGALERAGVAVDGVVRHGEATGDSLAPPTTVARHVSAPFSELVATMLRRSDNMIAESLVREVGVVAAGVGSTGGGLGAARDALAVLCVPFDGADHDGSGLSRSNRRSAGEWRALLEAARQRPWWPRLLDGLPVAGRSGTLAGRLGGPATAGNVRAKTGSIIPGRALSGYATTAGGRQVVFSLVVNGDRPGPASRALDELLTAVVSHPG